MPPDLPALTAAEIAVVVVSLGAAAALRPWRAAAAGSTTPALAGAALMPLLWAADRLAQAPLAPALSGAALLVLVGGWPLAMLLLPGVVAVLALLGDFSVAELLARWVWLGVLPGTLVMLGGAAVRHALPNHVFVYILGRGFFVPMGALVATGAGALALDTMPSTLTGADRLLAALLLASGEAFITGMAVAIFVAFRPQWLATYADRLYLPRGDAPGG